MATLTDRLHRAVIGAPKSVKDPHAFHELSLVALLAWVGLGADGLSSSAYGPDEAFRALVDEQGQSHTGLASRRRSRPRSGARSLANPGQTSGARNWLCRRCGFDTDQAAALVVLRTSQSTRGLAGNRRGPTARGFSVVTPVDVGNEGGASELSQPGSSIPAIQ